MDTTRPLWDLHQIEGNVEHDLFQSLIVEFTDISGIKIKYYIREERYNQYYFVFIGVFVFHNRGKKKRFTFM